AALHGPAGSGRGRVPDAALPGRQEASVRLGRSRDGTACTARWGRAGRGIVSLSWLQELAPAHGSPGRGAWCLPLPMRWPVLRGMRFVAVIGPSQRPMNAKATRMKVSRNAQDRTPWKVSQRLRIASHADADISPAPMRAVRALIPTFTMRVVTKPTDQSPTAPQAAAPEKLAQTIRITREDGMAIGMNLPNVRTSPFSTATWCSVGSRRITGCTKA